jgi:hypothetical protein
METEQPDEVVEAAEPDTEGEYGECSQCGSESELCNGLCSECEGAYCSACKDYTGVTDCRHIDRLDGDVTWYQGTVGVGCTHEDNTDDALPETMVKRSIQLLLWWKGRGFAAELYEILADMADFHPCRSGSMLGGMVTFDFRGSKHFVHSIYGKHELYAPALSYLWTLGGPGTEKGAEWVREIIRRFLDGPFHPKILRLPIVNLTTDKHRPWHRDPYGKIPLTPWERVLHSGEDPMDLEFINPPTGMELVACQALDVDQTQDNCGKREFLPAWMEWDAVALISPNNPNRKPVIRGLMWFEAKSYRGEKEYSFALGEPLSRRHLPPRTPFYSPYRPQQPGTFKEWIKGGAAL